MYETGDVYERLESIAIRLHWVLSLKTGKKSRGNLTCSDSPFALVLVNHVISL